MLLNYTCHLKSGLFEIESGTDESKHFEDLKLTVRIFCKMFGFTLDNHYSFVNELNSEPNMKFGYSLIGYTHILSKQVSIADTIPLRNAVSALEFYHSLKVSEEYFELVG